MDRIKFDQNDNQNYPIDKNLFEKKTRKSKLFNRKNASNEINQYAICPACNGPVQVIGLYKKLLNTDKPYGKHINYSLSGLATYYQADYDFCPYRAKRQEYDKETRKAEVNPLVLSIIQKLVLNFDRMIYLISKYTGIYISKSFAYSLLNDYFDSKAYLYPGSTLINIPFMLMYFMRANSLFYRRIDLKSRLAQTLENCREIVINNGKICNNIDCYQTLEFYFIAHETKLNQHTLLETLLFQVMLNNKLIYEDKLKLDPKYIENIIHFDQNKLSEKIRESNKVLLGIAKEVAQEKGFTF
ncbi:hypothetical protein BTV20_02440 [Histophilus somni]|uniref:Uncharacterized protein n=4 Tax=Histophilus somni TaxID=731 RepID=A0A9Q6Z0H0_HISSO|nr:hypothetical protein [Histophilus somni]ARU64442.1 hypothetical protein BTV18_02440 [Histophilus somni]ARU66229.1 hypothetical protein BTV19_02435 [Histophilus somni]ARU68103.1 hypothetical protein BTV16_02440 [Histophilus somni]ARU69984.1 hypothetical protein BTV20_02440 [Histophilus somni]ARU71858.1 hypothetical protein BTV17_02435 [Histophilus somni]